MKIFKNETRVRNIKIVPYEMDIIGTIKTSYILDGELYYIVRLDKGFYSEKRDSFVKDLPVHASNLYEACEA